jgi:hypothetical protein
VENKMEGVRRALGELGYDAKPQVIQEFVKTRFGLDMGTNMISNYKSVIIKKAAGQSTLVRRPREHAASHPAPGEGGFSLDELQAVKKVADRIGADKVRQLAEVLSR